MLPKPLYQTNVKRLPIGRKAVTVCIAAVCNGEKEKEEVIVALTDTKVTTGYYSSDIGSLKTEQLHTKWHAFHSGKIGQRLPIIEQIRGSLERSKDYNVQEVAEQCKKAYVESQRALAY